MKKLAISMTMCVSVGMCNVLSDFQQELANKCHAKGVEITEKYVNTISLDSYEGIISFGDANFINGGEWSNCNFWAYLENAAQVRNTIREWEKSFKSQMIEHKKIREAANQ